MLNEKEKNQSQKISKIYHLTLKDKDFRKLERCLHEYILCKEILEYTDTKKIGIWQVYKKIRKKLDPDWAEHLIDEEYYILHFMGYFLCIGCHCHWINLVLGKAFWKVEKLL